MAISRNILFITIAALLLTGCKLGKGDKPLTGGVFREQSDGTILMDTLPQRTYQAGMAGEGNDSADEARAEPLEEMRSRRLLPAALHDRPEQRLERKAYTVSYNRETRLPNWVAWTLTAQHTNGKHSRKGRNFQEDMDVPSPRATHYDYMRSGYDRGHMCPSGDNKWDATAQNQSFLLTNVCPQKHNLNTGDWNDLEIKCRHWAQRYGKIYIVSGPILYNQKHKTIGRSRVVVPEAFFKVVLRLGKHPLAIAFICRNESASRPLKEYVHTLKEAERITKMRFFEGLDPNIRKQIENDANLYDW